MYEISCQCYNASTMYILSMLRHFFKGEQMRMELDGLFRSNKPEQLINLNISLNTLLRSGSEWPFDQA